MNDVPRTGRPFFKLGWEEKNLLGVEKEKKKNLLKFLVGLVGKKGQPTAPFLNPIFPFSLPLGGRKKWKRVYNCKTDIK